MLMPSIKCCIKRLHVIDMQWTSKKCTKRCVAHAGLFCSYNKKMIIGIFDTVVVFIVMVGY